MDIVWLKRDVRINDHGPFGEITKSGSRRPLMIIYNYEPDQLKEKSVHGSHVCFVNEGLIDLDKRLSGNTPSINETHAVGEKYKFQVITVCHAGIVFTFNSILQQTRHMGGINRILTHEETGHLKSFARDKAVRRWCRANNIPITEFNQTGVKRCLKSRDDFSKYFQFFINQPLYHTPSQEEITAMRECLMKGLKLHGQCDSPLYPDENELLEIPPEHRCDREDRQMGGETLGLIALTTFLQNRGRHYSSGISSPNSSWTMGGRISPYITWGHLSTRYVIYKLKERQEELRTKKKKKTLDPIDGPFLRSLSAFSSRMHWRSHFIQKLESEPMMEKQDLCPAYQHLRRQPGDWNEDYYIAWSTGNTGFPFVDACMRCLLKHGWLNFRMRAMLISFATYNLWLDWSRISYHMARVFLDYEPGIHYPQLQMQAGTTGINAMRVYNVSKQGKDQDPEGIFIKKYIPELRNVPLEYIHEPWKMKPSMQEKLGIIIGSENRDETNSQQTLIAFKPKSSNTEIMYYSKPIVDEKESAKIAKDKVSSIRKQNSTKKQAEAVYIKHGSRSNRNGNMDGLKPKALSSAVKRVDIDDHGSQNIRDLFSQNTSKVTHTKEVDVDEPIVLDGDEEVDGDSISPSKKRKKVVPSKKVKSSSLIQTMLSSQSKHAPPGTNQTTVNKSASPKKVTEDKIMTNDGSWDCKACTFVNEKPFALACLICGTERR